MGQQVRQPYRRATKEAVLMGVKVSYTWEGNKLAKKVDRAAAAAVNAVNEEAAAKASEYSPVDTGRLRDSMRAVPAYKEGGRWVGIFGSFGTSYAIYVEGGARGRKGVFMIRRAADECLNKYGAVLRSLL